MSGTCDGGGRFTIRVQPIEAESSILANIMQRRAIDARFRLRHDFLESEFEIHS